LKARFQGGGRDAFDGPPKQWVEELARLALEDGIGTFIVMADDATAIQTFATEVALALREQVTDEPLSRWQRGPIEYTYTGLSAVSHPAHSRDALNVHV
jgi:hypothetical protein